MNDAPVVLLIDDHPAVREIVTSLLTRNGFEVEIAHSGERAFKLLARLNLDVIVCDTEGREFNGLELARRVRGDAASAEIPIIMLTERGGMEDQFEGYLAGADAYLTKPFRGRDLLAALDKVLTRKGDTRRIGRRGGSDEVARVLAVVAEHRRRMVASAMRQAGFELQVEDGLATGLQRMDRERFHLLICDTVHEPGSAERVKDFLSHFALATPVIFLHSRDGIVDVRENDPQFRALRVPATPAELSELARKAVFDFGGI
jgi:twitching motility two-component system response regulator PilH